MKIYRTLFDIQIFNQFLQLYYYALFLWRIKNRTEDTGFLRAGPLSSYFEDRRGVGVGEFSNDPITENALRRQL